MAHTIRLDRNPTLIESLGQGLNYALPGMVAGAQGRLRQEDLQGLINFNRRTGLQDQYQNALAQADRPAANLEQPMFPTFQTPQFQNIAAQGLMNRAFEDPMTKALRQAQLENVGARTEQIRKPDPTAGAPFTDEQGKTWQQDRFGNYKIIDESTIEEQRAERIQTEIDRIETIPSADRTDGQNRRLANLKRMQFGLSEVKAEKPTAREKEIGRIQEGLRKLNAKETLTPKDQKKKDFLERRLQSALYGEVKSTPKEELQDQGYDAEAAQRILDIKNGLQPRASSRVQYDSMGLEEKRKYLSTERQRAEGQYFGSLKLDEQFQAEREGRAPREVPARQPEYLEWIVKEQTIVQKALNQKSAGSKPPKYPDAVWSEEHGMWTIEKDGRTWGIE